MGKIKLITMSRDFGTDIDDLIRKLSQEIKGEVLDREKLYAELEKLGISREKIERNGELSKEEKEEFIDLYKEGIRKVVGNYLEKGMVFLLGRGGQFLYQGEDFVFHINVIAPLNYRVKYLCEKYPLSQEKALELIKEKDLQREIYYYSFFFSDWKDPYLYHLVIDKSFFSDREIEELIWKVLEKEEVPVPALEQLSFPTKPTFANESEEEFAKILSFYQIK